MKPVYAFLHRYAGRPFIWGECDCCLMIADWFLHLHGRDPAAHLRWTYDDPGSCQRAHGWLTDPVAVVERALDTVRTEALPCPRVEVAREGDVAVIEVPTQGRAMPVGAVWLGTHWGV